MKNQEMLFLTGNEAAAQAARAINFHFMGYFPITPSTEIAQLVDAMKARGEIDTVLLPADGEHGAAGACFGAATGGARVLNATSANGLLYSLEQLPSQAGSRLPMVLNLVTRSVSAPLDIRCDHSDLAFALQTGWILLMASNPQAVYDFNLIAVKLGEDPRVRLPVMVVSDGFFTSHQRQSVRVFADRSEVQAFIGMRHNPFTSLDPRKPVTFGPYMNDRDLINTKYQLHEAHNAALTVFAEIAREFEALTGRAYPALERYRMDDAETALYLVNSAAETAKDAIDQARNEGIRVGLLRPNLLRPFPFVELERATHQLRSIVIGERADTPGSPGGPLSHEVRSAILADHNCSIIAMSRTYGLGGRDFSANDASNFINEGVRALRGEDVATFAFQGDTKGEAKTLPPMILPALTREEMSESLVRLSVHESADGRTRVTAVAGDPDELTRRPKRIASGHSACPGCGIFSGLDQFFKGIEGDVVVLYHTGCAMVVTTDYPFSAHRVSYIHNLFQNGAPTLAGLVEAFHEKKRRGEIATREDITFVMITGDGGMDIGLGPTLGTAFRNHGMIIIEYDNQGYMNTGGQLSYATPLGHATVTSHIGPRSSGKAFHHRDTLQLMAASEIPYVFSAVESTGTDLVAKAAKAQWYAKNRGLAFGKLLVTCPLNWKSEERDGVSILQKAVDSCFFPLYEIEEGITALNYDPDRAGKRIPVRDWLATMGKTRHLLRDDYADALARLQAEVDRRWARLKARAEHPLL